MKKILAIALAALAMNASAATWWVGNTLFSNVCRSGGWYFVFASYSAPVGSACYFTIPQGTFYGTMSAE